MFNIGDTAYDNLARQTIQVIEKSDLWGIRSYKVLDTSTGQVYRVPEKRLRCSAADTGLLSENYLRYVVEISRIKNEISGGILTPLSCELIPLPHQLHALSRAMVNNNVRYLLADEVGLGKTIETGLILKELKTRGLVRRTLVVCPTGLVTQWANEMSEKFGEKFHVVLPSDFETIRKLTDSDDVYGQFEQVIAPMDSIKPLEQRVGWSEERIREYNDERLGAAVNGDWDLVIIDEAHRVAGSSSDVARHKLGLQLAKASPYLLLLTATPHNGKSEPFLRLVRLLDRSAFPNAKSVVREQVAPYLIRTEKREAIDNQGNRLFKDRVTHLVQIEWDGRHTMQRQLYELVSEYVSKTYNQALREKKRNMCLIFLLIIMQRMVTSSTAAVRQSLERRLAVLQAEATEQHAIDEVMLGEIDIEDGDEAAYGAVSLNNKAEIAELEGIIGVAKQAELQYQDVKVDVLIDALDSALSDADAKAIVFSEFMATQNYLKQILERRGYTVTLLNGSMNIDERNLAMTEFRDKSDIFISTDAGGEGLNLQFANVVINYDMPWNPMKIEQRCGRVDRIGQKRDVQVYNFMIEGTVESRVYEVIGEKLSVILTEFGIDKYSDVLDSESVDLDFTNAYMQSIGKPGRVEMVVEPIEKEVRQQAANAESYHEIIREDKDLGGLVGAESDFDVNAALRRALGYYASWHGLDGEMPQGEELQSEIAMRLLRGNIVQDRGAAVLSVGIEDFPNEAGYFILWELSVADDQRSVRTIPVFVNENMVVRPIAGKRIMAALLAPGTKLVVGAPSDVDGDVWGELERLSMEHCYNDFRELAEEHARRSKENHDKYAYALELRADTARRIGIENIRTSKMARIADERARMEADYECVSQVLPEFKCSILVRLGG